MRIGRRVALAIPCVALLVGCGGKGGGTTIVITKGAPEQAPLGIYRVPSGSMEPTLNIGERVEVTTGQPRVGEIVVFYPPQEAELEVCGPRPHMVRVGTSACSEPIPSKANIKFVKRIVAGPGDTIKIVEGHVIRNGKRESDSYIRPCPGVSECNFPVPIKIPAGHWFMLGDNRGESDDSRFWGPVPTSWIVGTVQANGG
jgi:signal peptidase I